MTRITLARDLLTRRTSEEIPHAPRFTAEIQRPFARNMFGEKCREIAKCAVVRVSKFQAGIGCSTSRVVVTISERHSVLRVRFAELGLFDHFLDK